MRRRIPILLSLALLVAACGDDSGSPVIPASTAAPTAADTSTTTAAPAATAAATTTVPPTTAAPSTTAAPTTSAAPAASPAPVASGSGCTPPGDTLPDGDWFGFIEGIAIAADTRITFDLACHFDGAEAELAANEDSYPTPLESPPYVRNQNPKVFDIPVAGGAVFEDFLAGPIPFPDWVASIPADNGCSDSTGYAACPIWVEINSGTAVRLYGLLPEWSGDDRG